MTRTTNARIAGFTFLAYIALAFPAMLLMGRATSGEGIAAKLAGIAQHSTDVRTAVVLNLFSCFAALILAVTLWAITRDNDPDVAMLGLTCRVGEGILGGVSNWATLGLLWLATTTGPNAPDTSAAHALGEFFLKAPGWNVNVGATFFAVGSTAFSYLFLRGRMIPIALAWLGVVASVLLVIGLPLQFAGVIGGPIAQLMWLPMAAFEIPLGFWLLIKGVAMPIPRSAGAGN